MSKLMIRNRIRVASNPGNPIIPIYVRRKNKSGETTMVVKETKNVYEEIQTFKNDNNVYKILNQFGGDIEKIDFNKGYYMDMTRIPDNYIDFYNQSQELREDYDLLPINIKQALNNNFSLYYGLAMTGKLKDTIEAFVKKDTKIIKQNLSSINFDNVKDDKIATTIKKNESNKEVKDNG